MQSARYEKPLQSPSVITSMSTRSELRPRCAPCETSPPQTRRWLRLHLGRRVQRSSTLSLRNSAHYGPASSLRAGLRTLAAAAVRPWTRDIGTGRGAEGERCEQDDHGKADAARHSETSGNRWWTVGTPGNAPNCHP